MRTRRSAGPRSWRERATEIWHFDDASRSDASFTCISEGRNLAYVAEQVGDSIDTVQRTYLHVIEELLGQPNVPAEKAIRDARQRVSREGVPKVCLDLARVKVAAG